MKFSGFDTPKQLRPHLTGTGLFTFIKTPFFSRSKFLYNNTNLYRKTILINQVFTNLLLTQQQSYYVFFIKFFITAG